MKRFSCIAAIALVAVVITSGWMSEESSRAEALASITIPEIRDHIFYLASDELEGRDPGTDGYRISALYAASQFRAAGLQPIIADEDGNLSYLQPVALTKTFKGEENRLIVHAGEKTHEFAHGSDFGLLSAGTDTEYSGEKLELVYVGYGISEPKDGWDDYEGLDVEGKFVVLQAGVPMKDGEPALSEKLLKKYEDPARSLLPRYMTILGKKAAGFMIIPPTVDMGMSWDNIIRFIVRPQVSLKGARGGVNPLAMIRLPSVLANAAVSEMIFADAPYNPTTGEGEYSTFALDGVHISLNASIRNEEFFSHNVVGMLPGSDATLKDEFVTIGAHLDHEGVLGGEVFNGADDNASGSVAVIEAAEALAMTPPRRSSLFILYTAEEKGLLGSQYFVENPPVPVENMVLNINMDMVGRETESAPGGIEVIGSARRSSELKPIIIAANDAGIGLALDFGTDEDDPQNFFGRSDHYNFHKKGVVAVFFSSGQHDDYTTPADDPEKIVLEKIQKVAQLCYNVAVEVGNRDKPLVKDIE